jgi:sugar fermentation stimulation protein A
VVRATLEGGEDGGRVVSAHLPDPGRLRELLLPGTPLWLEPARNPERKTQWTLRLCRHPDGPGVVSLDTTLPNRLVERALEDAALDELEGWALARREVTVGASRFDFLLERHRGSEPEKGGSGVREAAPSTSHPLPSRLLLEVKSVTLVEDGVGLFPDAVTARGARHVRELTQLTREEGWATAVLFVLQREDASEIRAAASIDPHFASELQRAQAAGVRILGRRCRVSLEGVEMGEPIPAGPG